MMKQLRVIAVAFFCVALLGVGPVSFTVPGVDDVPDLHGSPTNADLVIFAAGNQFMVMPALLSAFQRAHPEVKRIYYETLPPGILVKQMRAGALRIGNIIIDVHPDVVLFGSRMMARMRANDVVSAPVAYATNALAIEVRSGNPKRVASLRDLGRADVRVAMPNPKWEGVAKQIERAFRKAGGDALEREILVAKVGNGTTLLTKIHHRQTPRWIIAGTADAGPVWISEALYQKRVGAPIAMVAIPARENVTALYEAAAVLQAPHGAAANAFVTFIGGPTAQAIYASYGFAPPPAAKEHP